MDSTARDRLAAARPGFVHHQVARFQDVDAAGIVFFPRIFEYFHDAYVAFLDQGGVSLAEVLRSGAWAAPLRDAEAAFLAPIRFGDPLQVGICEARWADSELSLGYRIAHAEGRVAAVGQTRHVFVDPSRFTRMAPPAAVRLLFDRLERPAG